MYSELCYTRELCMHVASGEDFALQCIHNFYLNFVQYNETLGQDPNFHSLGKPLQTFENVRLRLNREMLALSLPRWNCTGNQLKCYSLEVHSLLQCYNIIH